MPASPASLPTLWALCSLLLLLPLRSSISWPLGKFLFTFSLSNHFREVFQGSAMQPGTTSSLVLPVATCTLTCSTAIDFFPAVSPQKGEHLWGMAGGAPLCPPGPASWPGMTRCSMILAAERERECTCGRGQLSFPLCHLPGRGFQTLPK